MDTSWTVLIALVLLVFSAIFSGLNIGMMMLRPEDLERKARQGDDIARRVYRYRKDGNYLITCILLGNVSVVSAFTLVLESMVGGLIAGLITTFSITIVGEILPQSLFSRRGYQFARYFFVLLDVIFVLLWPIAKPISLLLDRFVGKEPPSLYTHQELADLVEDHAKHRLSPIDHDESRIMIGALRFSKKTAGQVATPIKDITAVELDEDIDSGMVSLIKREGHSRLPVVNAGGEYVGVLFIKDILGRKLPTPVRHVYRDKIYDLPASSALDTALSRFIQTKTHLFLVRDQDDKPVGVLTLEDVIEEIINREIEDEHERIAK